MDDKGKGGLKNLQKLVTSFMDGPKCKIKILLLADENAQRIGFKNIPHLLLYMSDEQINLKKLIISKYLNTWIMSGIILMF